MDDWRRGEGPPIEVIDLTADGSLLTRETQATNVNFGLDEDQTGFTGPVVGRDIASNSNSGWNDSHHRHTERYSQQQQRHHHHHRQEDEQWRNQDPRVSAIPADEPQKAVREGFTRNTGGDDIVICPSCDQELAYDPDDDTYGDEGRSKEAKPEHPFWAVKTCGHVRYLHPPSSLSIFSSFFSSFFSFLLQRSSPDRY